jgi:hypothetical protein
MAHYEIWRHKYARGVQYAVRHEDGTVTGACLLPPALADPDYEQLTGLAYDADLGQQLSERRDECEPVPAERGRHLVVPRRILRLALTFLLGLCVVAVVLILAPIVCAIALIAGLVARIGQMRPSGDSE